MMIRGGTGHPQLQGGFEYAMNESIIDHRPNRHRIKERDKPAREQAHKCTINSC